MLIEAAGTWGASCGATAMASAAAMPDLHLAGIMRLLNGGAMATTPGPHQRQQEGDEDAGARRDVHDVARRAHER